MSDYNDLVNDINSIAVDISRTQDTISRGSSKIDRLQTRLVYLMPEYDEDGNDRNSLERERVQSQIHELELLLVQLNSQLAVQQNRALKLSLDYQNSAQNVQRVSYSTLNAKRTFDKLANGKFAKSVATSYSASASQRAQSYLDEKKVYSSLSEAASDAAVGIANDNIETSIADKGSFQFSGGKVNLERGNAFSVAENYVLNKDITPFNNVSKQNNVLFSNSKENKETVSDEIPLNKSINNLNIANTIYETMGISDNITLENSVFIPMISEDDKNVSDEALDSQYGKMYGIEATKMQEYRTENALEYVESNNVRGIVPRELLDSLQNIKKVMKSRTEKHSNEICGYKVDKSLSEISGGRYYFISNNHNKFVEYVKNINAYSSDSNCPMDRVCANANEIAGIYISESDFNAPVEVFFRHDDKYEIQSEEYFPMIAGYASDVSRFLEKGGDGETLTGNMKACYDAYFATPIKVYECEGALFLLVLVGIEFWVHKKPM